MDFKSLISTATTTLQFYPGSADAGYSIGCNGSFTNGDGEISNGQTLCVRHTAFPAGGAVTRTTVKVGGVSGSFVSTTADNAPVDYPPAPPGESYHSRWSTGAIGAPLLWMFQFAIGLRALRRRSGR